MPHVLKLLCPPTSSEDLTVLRK
jgi:DNA polymerase theta